MEERWRKVSYKWRVKEGKRRKLAPETITHGLAGSTPTK